jgi:hypothetical protein
MALTRALLKAMGIEGEQQDQIIQANVESIAALKNERDSYKAEAEKMAEVQKELDTLKASQPKDLTADYETLKKEYEDYKQQIADEKTKAEKETLYRDLLKAQGVDEKRLSSIMKLADLNFEVEDGKIKDADKLAEGIKTEWADFIVSEGEKGADVSNPPTNGDKAPDFENMSMADYVKYRTKE